MIVIEQQSFLGALFACFFTTTRHHEVGLTRQDFPTSLPFFSHTRTLNSVDQRKHTGKYKDQEAKGKHMNM